MKERSKAARNREGREGLEQRKGGCGLDRSARSHGRFDVVRLGRLSALRISYHVRAFNVPFPTRLARSCIGARLIRSQSAPRSRGRERQRVCVCLVPLHCVTSRLPSERREGPDQDIRKPLSSLVFSLSSPSLHTFLAPPSPLLSSGSVVRAVMELITPTLGASVLGDTSSPHMDYVWPAGREEDSAYRFGDQPWPSKRLIVYQYHPGSPRHGDGL